MNAKDANRAQQRTDRPDPLVDEVREVRRAIFEECGNDLDRLFAFLRQVQDQHASRVVRETPRARATGAG